MLDHHERLDGTGYPHGRHSTSTWRRASSPSATCTTLLSVRVYRGAWTHDKAIGLLREQTGSAFDPGCVAALERVLARDALVLGVAV